MSQISFNPKAIGKVATGKDADMRSPGTECAFIPVVIGGTGIEPLKEGLRLANIERFPSVRRNPPTKDVDA